MPLHRGQRADFSDRNLTKQHERTCNLPDLQTI